MAPLPDRRRVGGWMGKKSKTKSKTKSTVGQAAADVVPEAAPRNNNGSSSSSSSSRRRRHSPHDYQQADGQTRSRHLSPHPLAALATEHKRVQRYCFSWKKKGNLRIVCDATDAVPPVHTLPPRTATFIHIHLGFDKNAAMPDVTLLQTAREKMVKGDTLDLAVCFTGLKNALSIDVAMQLVECLGTAAITRLYICVDDAFAGEYIVKEQSNQTWYARVAETVTKCKHLSTLELPALALLEPFPDTQHTLRFNDVFANNIVVYVPSRIMVSTEGPNIVVGQSVRFRGGLNNFSLSLSARKKVTRSGVTCILEVFLLTLLECTKTSEGMHMYVCAPYVPKCIAEYLAQSSITHVLSLMFTKLDSVNDLKGFAATVKKCNGGRISVAEGYIHLLCKWRLAEADAWQVIKCMPYVMLYEVRTLDVKTWLVNVHVFPCLHTFISDKNDYDAQPQRCTRAEVCGGFVAHLSVNTYRCQPCMAHMNMPACQPCRVQRGLCIAPIVHYNAPAGTPGCTCKVQCPCSRVVLRLNPIGNEKLVLTYQNASELQHETYCRDMWMKLCNGEFDTVRKLITGEEERAREMRYALRVAKHTARNTVSTDASAVCLLDEIMQCLAILSLKVESLTTVDDDALYELLASLRQICVYNKQQLAKVPNKSRTRM